MAYVPWAAVGARAAQAIQDVEAKATVRSGAQSVLRRRRRASWAKPSGAAATTQASGVSLVSLVAGRSQEAADSGQSTTARTVPPPARQAVLKVSAASRDASSRLWFGAGLLAHQQQLAERAVDHGMDPHGRGPLRLDDSVLLSQPEVFGRERLAEFGRRASSCRGAGPLGVEGARHDGPTSLCDATPSSSICNCSCRFSKMMDVDELSTVLAAVGPRLRALRRQRGITLADLAETTGISESTLSRLESGGRRPTLELLLPLARAYGVPLDELVGAPRTGDPRVHLRPVRRSGMTFVPLSRRAGGMQAHKLVIPPTRQDTEPDLKIHEGHEWVYVLSGRLRLLLGDQDLVLKPGEVAEFDTHLPHWLGSADSDAVELLVLFGPQGERAHLRARAT